MKLFSGLALRILCIASIGTSKEILLHKPTGPYHVTYTQHVFNHTTPNDFTAPNGTDTGTILLVSIFAPTEQAPNGTVPYMDATNAQLWETALGFPPSTLSTLVTSLQWEAPTLSGPGFSTGTSPYPSLLFMPGAGMPTFAYTAYLSELASWGYSVFALDHPGEPPYLELPDHLGGVRSAFPPLSSYAWTFAQFQQIYAHRLRDAAALLSPPYLPALVRERGAPFNLSHVGVFGHSIGGAASAGLMATARDHHHPNLLAGANLDGWFFFDIWDLYGNGTSSNNTSSSYPDLAPRPFLELARDDPAGPDATWTNFSAAQTGWLRDVAVRATAHFDFSDVPLWVDLLGQRDGGGAPGEFMPGNFIGDIDGRRVTEVVNAFLRKFFAYVGGGGGGGGGKEGLGAVDGLVKKFPETYVRESQDVAEVYVDRGL